MSSGKGIYNHHLRYEIYWLHDLRIFDGGKDTQSGVPGCNTM
jgi:hypothetical protein